MWDAEEAVELHKEFHDKRDPHKGLYSKVLEAFDETFAPTGASRSTQLTLYETVYNYLTRWGHIPKTKSFRTDSETMTRKLQDSSYRDLVARLRDCSIAETDLSEKLAWSTGSRTIAGCMQAMLKDLSETSPSGRRNFVAASKLLHAAIPRLFVILDNLVCECFLGTKQASVPVYCGLFLPLAKVQIGFLRDHGLTPDPAEACGGNWAKFVDEINWTWAKRKREEKKGET
jgi:hypothetical protein